MAKFFNGEQNLKNIILKWFLFFWGQYTRIRQKKKTLKFGSNEVAIFLARKQK
jgi:hypothetical protein